jgi:hypothetical protein
VAGSCEHNDESSGSGVIELGFIKSLLKGSDPKFDFSQPTGRHFQVRDGRVHA